MERMVKVGIIGCGGIANGKHLPSLKKLQNVKLVAFCDIDRSRAEKAKQEYGAEDASVYTDYKEMIEQEKEIEVIHVCTPNNSHSEITCCALYAGKHVMCEKPMAKTAEQAEAMLKAAKETGKKLTIGYQNRFRSDSLYLKEACKANELGDIYYAKAYAIRRRAVPTWGVFLDAEAQGGGPLIDIGTHALDLTLWMMDNYKPKSVKGSVYRKLAEQKNTGNAWGDWDPEKYTVEDSAFGFITMENGATIVLESSWALNTLDVKEAKTTLCGTLGGADMEDGLRINNVKHGKQNIERPALKANGVAFYDGNEMSPEALEAKMWIDAVIHDREPMVTPEQAFTVTKILEAIYQSAKTGETICF
mgnify:CR=1 FL=1